MKRNVKQEMVKIPVLEKRIKELIEEGYLITDIMNAGPSDKLVSYEKKEDIYQVIEEDV